MTYPSMQRWTFTLSGCQYILTYIPGRDNMVADTLSRLPIEGHSVTKPNPYEVVHFLQSLSALQCLAGT